MSRKSYNIRTLENIRNNEKESITKEKEMQNYNIKKNKISEIIIKENIVTTQQKTIKKKTYSTITNPVNKFKTNTNNNNNLNNTTLANINEDKYKIKNPFKKNQNDEEEYYDLPRPNYFESIIPNEYEHNKTSYNTPLRNMYNTTTTNIQQPQNQITPIPVTYVPVYTDTINQTFYSPQPGQNYITYNTIIPTPNYITTNTINNNNFDNNNINTNTIIPSMKEPHFDYNTRTFNPYIKNSVMFSEDTKLDKKYGINSDFDYVNLCVVIIQSNFRGYLLRKNFFYNVKNYIAKRDFFTKLDNILFYHLIYEPFNAMRNFGKGVVNKIILDVDKIPKIYEKKFSKEDGLNTNALKKKISLSNELNNNNNNKN